MQVHAKHMAVFMVPNAGKHKFEVTASVLVSSREVKNEVLFLDRTQRATARLCVTCEPDQRHVEFIVHNSHLIRTANTSTGNTIEEVSIWRVPQVNEQNHSPPRTSQDQAAEVLTPDRGTSRAKRGSCMPLVSVRVRRR